MAFRDHLNDRTTYLPITREYDMQQHADVIKRSITEWMKKYKKVTSRSEKTFLRTHLRNNEKPFARFYTTLKAHKLKRTDPISALRSRPIVSCPGSLVHPLGIWVDS